MAAKSSSTRFPIGAFLNTPDGSSASNQAEFQTNYDSFTTLMGTSPSYLDYYSDYNQPVSSWVSQASWQAWSAALSTDASTATAVIGLPMYSIASGELTADQQYQEIISGADDSVITGILDAWVAQGFTTLVFRPGYEMNIPGNTYAGDSAQEQSDWVAAFQHIYTVLHQAADAAGVSVTVAWNPSTTNYSNAEATTNLYPGNDYVDLISVDVYADMYPYSDTTSGDVLYHDWDTGGEDTSLAEFIADPVNREHYWSNPAATEWSSDSSGGHSQSLDSLIQFAEQQGKPFAVSEAGAGNSDSGHDVQDDPEFATWLAAELTAAQAAGETIKYVNLWDSNSGGNYEFSNASDGKPLEAAAFAESFGVQTLCFCQGTRIRSLKGEVAVEDLAIGDMVLTWRGEAKPITWIGIGRVLATRGSRSAATPVIVRKGALADNVPFADLHVTKGHSIYLEGALIPVEFLVNHRSILWDDRAQEVCIYHVELAGHDVLIANGAPAESYRDDGNRWLFQNSSERWTQDPQLSCAPVLTGGPLVDRVWRRLLDRSGARPGLRLTDDPDLHLQVNGSRINPERQGSSCIFQLPAARSNGVRVLSRAAAPAELGLTRDPRMLGIAVRRLALRDGTRFRIIDAIDPRLVNGFHTYEPTQGLRWTNGNALLDPDLFKDFDDAVELVLHVCGSTKYIADTEHAAA